jgi:uncharacterized membrane protein
MKYLSGDRYEYILVGSIFGMIGISITLMLLLFFLPHRLLTLNHPPQYWIIINKILDSILIVVFTLFWFSVIRKGRKIMKKRNEENINE